MKAFIDCGAYTGDTCNLFMERPEVFGVENPAQYELYALEPGRQKWDFHFPAALINQAVWIEDGHLNFTGGSGNQGATVMVPKEVRPGETVECLDFATWLRRFEGYEEVIVKLDIEGAEYPVLERLLETGAIKIITWLFVEFHPGRFPDGFQRRDKLLAAIERMGIPCRQETGDWSKAK